MSLHDALSSLAARSTNPRPLIATAAQMGVDAWSVANEVSFSALSPQRLRECHLASDLPQLQRASWLQAPGPRELALQVMLDPAADRDVIVGLVKAPFEWTADELCQVLDTHRRPDLVQPVLRADVSLAERAYPLIRHDEELVKEMLRGRGDYAFVVADRDASIELRRQAARKSGSDPCAYEQHREELLAGLNADEAAHLHQGATRFSIFRRHHFMTRALAGDHDKRDDLVTLARTRADLEEAIALFPEHARAAVDAAHCDLVLATAVLGRAPHRDDRSWSRERPLWLVQQEGAVAALFSESHPDPYGSWLRSFAAGHREQAAQLMLTQLPSMLEITDDHLFSLAVELIAVLGAPVFIKACPAALLMRLSGNAHCMQAISDELEDITTTLGTAAGVMLLTSAQNSTEPIANAVAAVHAALR